MCLVISFVLGALGINFFLNGFYAQAIIMSVLSLGFALLMIRNIRCRKNACKTKEKTPEENISDEKEGL